MTPCPPPETLVLLLEGQLPADEADGLRQHLSACAGCQKHADSYGDDGELRRMIPLLRRPARSGPEPAGLGPLMARLRISEGDTPAAHDSFGSALGPPLRDGDLGTIGPYHVEAELGRGGMGIVYLGFDQALRRPVALKVLRADVADARSRARLIREARLTAQVRHDHLVAIHAVLDAPGSPPCLVMEYVPGQSLAQRVRAQPPLSVQEVARLAAEVADALAAAHSVSLIHRDVKPANVLIDAQTKRARLTDFGLALDVEQCTGLTREGALIGTPAYMSPEQARGEPATALSDLYGLGATLYEALTGEPPFRGTPARVIHQILHDEPRPPRQLNDAIPRDLETVCLKALAPEPGRRYASAAALAADLRRFLNGEPVLARATTPAERAWRWARRYPVVATLSLSLVVVVIGSLAGLTALWLKAEASAKTAEEQREQAEANLEEAEVNLRDACKTVDQFFTRVSGDQMLARPGMQPFRKKLLQDALRSYRSFLERRKGRFWLKEDVAEAYFRIAGVSQEVDTGEEAVAAWKEAVSHWEELASGASANPGHLHKLAVCYGQLGVALDRAGRLDEAEPAVRRARDLFVQVEGANPNEPTAQVNLASCLGVLANLSLQRGKPAEAVKWYQEICSVYGRLLRAAPDNFVAQYLLGVTENNLAMALGNLGQNQESLEALQRARTIRARLVELKKPNPLRDRRNLAATDMNLALVFQKLGRPEEARQSHSRAIETLDQLVKENPTVIEFQLNLGMACLNLGSWHSARNEWTQADPFWARGRSAFLEVLRVHPSHFQAQYQLTLVTLAAGTAARMSEKAADALSLLRETKDRLDAMIRSHPTRLDLRNNLGRALEEIALAQELLGQRSEAVGTLEQAVQQQRLALAAAPKDAGRRDWLASHYHHLARICCDLGQESAAAAASKAREKLLAAGKP